MNLFAGRANVALAQTSKTFAELGFNNTNIEIVYEIGSSIRSWKPGRPINSITATVSGRGYYIIPKIDLDKEADFATHLETIITYEEGTLIYYPTT